MRHLPSLVSILCALGAPAAAQSFNLDVEHVSHSAPLLPDAYGGEPFQQGRWQKVTFPAMGPLAPTPLVDITGATTGVTLQSSQTGARNSPDCGPIWSADDVNFYDGIRREGGAMFVRLSGLQNGWYTVFVYGVDEQSQGTSAATFVRLIVPGGATSGLLYNNGSCDAAHSHLTTFASGTARVVMGELVVQLNKTVGGDGTSYALSALQLDFRVGDRFCPANPNSTGAVSTISAMGTQGQLGVVSVGADNLVLVADNAPPGTSGFFFYSLVRNTGAGAYGTLGGGYRCLLGSLGRLPAADTLTSPGFMIHPLDYASASNVNHLILPGSTWHFQGVYFDASPQGFNLTNGLTLQFGP